MFLKTVFYRSIMTNIILRRVCKKPESSIFIIFDGIHVFMLFYNYAQNMLLFQQKAWNLR